MNRKTLKQKMYEETRTVKTIKEYNRDRTKATWETVYEEYYTQNFNTATYEGKDLSDLDEDTYKAMLVVDNLYNLGLFEEDKLLSEADKKKALEYKQEELAYYKEHGSPFTCAPKMLRMRPSLGIDRDTPRVENEMRLLEMLDFSKIRRDPPDHPPYLITNIIESHQL